MSRRFRDGNRLCVEAWRDVATFVAEVRDCICITPQSALQSVLASILVGDSSLSTWEQKLLIPFEGGSSRKRVSFILWFALASAACPCLLAEKLILTKSISSTPRATDDCLRGQAEATGNNHGPKIYPIRIMSISSSRKPTS